MIRCINERIFNDENNVKIEEKDINKKNKHSIKNKKIKRIIETLKNMEKYNENQYYIFLIYSYIKSERSEFLIEEELNNLDLAYYINIENRILWKIYSSL